MTEIFMNDKQIATKSILELRMNKKGSIQAKKYYGNKQKIWNMIGHNNIYYKIYMMITKRLGQPIKAWYLTNINVW